MSDLIIEGAKGIPDGLYVIKDGELFKYKPNRNTVYTVRSYHIMDRPKGEWVNEEGIHGAVYCSECSYELRVNNTNFCPNCGADMRGNND